MRYTLKNIAILTVAFFLTIVTFSTSFAANVEVEMLNKQDKERMVYSQKIVRVNVGEKVIWKATSKGHNVEFIKGGVPEGVKKFKSKTSKDTDYTFDVPGIYAYWCTPHKTMGMIGFVIVGDDKSNLEVIKKLRFSGKSKKLAKELFSSL
jgi:pseudoazurin|tara:strand:+ start:1618 stop:2067 length:450 start_codon:yes stop_codon:yes gene_type:complete